MFRHVPGCACGGLLLLTLALPAHALAQAAATTGSVFDVSGAVIPAAEVTGLVDSLCGIGHRQAIHFLWRPRLRDPADEFVLELAVAAECDAVVTHNVRDFAGAGRLGVQIMTPAALVRRLEERL